MTIHSSQFITFEGTEGVGKTTVIDGVCQHLTKLGIDFVRTREPGGSEVGEMLRKIFLNPAHALSPASELLMIFSARSDHLDKVILPALNAGKWVICDRFLDSTVAYQGFGRWHGDPVHLANIDLLASTFIKRLPDKRFWLDLDVATGLERASKRSSLDRLESEKLPFFERVYQGFEYQYRHSTQTPMYRIDASPAPDEVLRQVLECLLLGRV